MNSTLLIAGVLTIIVGLIHSILGEILIFSRMRQGTLVPIDGQPLLRERHVRILWASWHLISIFGFGFAAIFIHAAIPGAGPTELDIVVKIASAVMFLSSLCVLFATKGRHPGWIGLLGVAALAWFG